MQPIFITGIGTDVGKTLVAAIITEALQADYWKPVQAGFASGTDAEYVRGLLSNPVSIVHDELYRLHTPASPHIAARKDGLTIEPELIRQRALALQQLAGARPLVIEGAGGLLVPLTETIMVADLIAAMNAKVIIVSRNYLGSINHSLLTAAYCRSRQLNVSGWIFNDDYLSYQQEIVSWSGYPGIGSVPHLAEICKETITLQAAQLRVALTEKLLL
jgi:dethiobiotin synthetase